MNCPAARSGELYPARLNTEVSIDIRFADKLFEETKEVDHE
jgi:hypothetical protein